jgi:hypothetical protein
LVDLNFNFSEADIGNEIMTIQTRIRKSWALALKRDIRRTQLRTPAGDVDRVKVRKGIKMRKNRTIILFDNMCDPSLINLQPELGPKEDECIYIFIFYYI